MSSMDDEDCAYDALLADIVQQARQSRQSIRSPYSDPEEAFTDGYVAGWFDGHFRTPPVGTAQKEEEVEQSY